jgi:DNA helicase-2/ATP-dependent DNA helicase PcrA
VAAARHAGRRTTGTTSQVVDALRAYQKIKTARGIIDLDDVLSISLGLFERDREFAEVMRWRFRHILIDEAQDLNPLQHRLIEHLRRGTEDMFMVGDPAQAVYGFNGADPGLLIDVADRFPGIEVIRLATNHRCTPQVVEAGAHVLTTSEQTATAAISSRADGPAVTIRAASDETHEAEMAMAFLRRCDPELIRSGNVAVLARTHAQISVVRDLFERHQIPIMTRVDGPGSPYRASIEAAGRLSSASRLRAWAHDLLEEAEERPERSSAEREVAACVLDYLRENPMGDGLGVRTWFVTTDPLGHGKQMGVELLTFHASKGREWHTVLVTGVETGLVPHRSASTQAARAEEARLLYVALTRARDRLWVSWSGRRGGYRRQISPLIQTLVTDQDPAIPPPAELLATTSRTDHLRPTVIAGTPRDVHRELLAWRAQRARLAGMLPEQFCSMAVLRSIASQRPLTAAALADCSGVGVLTAQRWLPSLTEVLAQHQPAVHDQAASTQHLTRRLTSD